MQARQAEMVYSSCFVFSSYRTYQQKITDIRTFMFNDENTKKPLFRKKRKGENQESNSKETSQKLTQPLFRKRTKKTTLLEKEEEPVKDISEMNAEEKAELSKKIRAIGRGEDEGVWGKLKKLNREKKERRQEKKWQAKKEKEELEKQEKQKKLDKQAKQKARVKTLFSALTGKKKKETTSSSEETKPQTQAEKIKAQKTYNELIDIYAFIYNVKPNNYFNCYLENNTKN